MVYGIGDQCPGFSDRLATSPTGGRRRLLFTLWVAFLVAVYGVVFFGLTSLAIGWFVDLEGTAGPVTEIGYGALLGIILTVGIASQLRQPERRVAGVYQATLVIPALAAGSFLARDAQNLEPIAILVPALAVLWVLHPAGSDLWRPRWNVRPWLVSVALVGAIPLAAYAVAMGSAAQEVVGPPHHVRLPSAGLARARLERRGRTRLPGCRVRSVPP